MDYSVKKAVVIGGSNGIGLTIAQELMKKGYYAIILDMADPNDSLAQFKGRYEYQYCNLLNYSFEQITTLAHDSSVEVLMITAGFGRVADFEFLHPAEIRKLLTVNTSAGIEVIRCFYDRIKSKRPFYCGMMGSIAGLVSSPMFSVYAASKAAICRFIESINIELEVSGTQNRILNVSPGSIKGTRFNGATANRVDMMSELASNIVKRILNHEEIFIPDYEETYRDVLERYNADPHAFGLSSYEYKKNSGRVVNESHVRVGYLSGTFDLFHVGHLNLLQRAKEQCDYLIVGVHPNAAHKGKEAFIPFEERMRIIGATKYVDRVVPSCPEDSQAWEMYHYNKLFVGSDYKGTERFKRYEEFFQDKGVKIVYFPYTAGTSSTQIRKTVLMKTNDIAETEKQD